MAIEQWGFFSMPHLPWRGVSYPRTHDTHNCCRPFGREAVTTCCYVCRGWDSNIQPFAREANAQTDCASHFPTDAVFQVWLNLVLEKKIFSRALLKALAIGTLIACLTINSSKQKRKQIKVLKFWNAEACFEMCPIANRKIVVISRYST